MGPRDSDCTRLYVRWIHVVAGVVLSHRSLTSELRAVYVNSVHLYASYCIRCGTDASNSSVQRHVARLDGEEEEEEKQYYERGINRRDA